MRRPGAPAFFAWKVIIMALAKGYATRPRMTSSAGKRNREPRVRSCSRKRWTLSPRQPNPRRDDGRGRLTVVDVAIAHILQGVNPPRLAGHNRAPGGRSQVPLGARGGG